MYARKVIVMTHGCPKEETMTSTTGSRLAALRAVLAGQDLQGFIVPRADEHLGDYVPPRAERLAWLTGFTGSAGLAAILPDHAAVFTDGRYVLQLEAETDASVWERCHITETPPPAWIAGHAPQAARIGYDPMLISQEGLAKYTEAGLTVVPVAGNPVDAVWADQPAPPLAPVVPQPLEYAGKASAAKREEIAASLRAARQDAGVLTDPASVAWLLNIRGGDVPFTPFALGFALVEADGGAALFMEPAKLSDEARQWLGGDVALHGRDGLAPALRSLAGRTVRVDGAGSPVWFAQTLREAGAVVANGPDPCLLPKARKNETEQAGARAAHARDAVALCRFLHWLAEAGPAGTETELSAASRLLALRAEGAGFRGESFPAISGAGEHG